MTDRTTGIEVEQQRPVGWSRVTGKEEEKKVRGWQGWGLHQVLRAGDSMLVKMLYFSLSVKARF